MMSLIPTFERDALWIVWGAASLAAAMMLAVVAQRLALAAYDSRSRRVERRYGPLLTRALAGDAEAVRTLTASPPKDQLAIATLLVMPLIADRNPARIAVTRKVARALSIEAIIDRFLQSPWWWRRVLALRAVGLLQTTDRTATVVAALNDSTSEVRNAALDALADLEDPSALLAIVVHLNDTSLQRGRRLAALTAFGPKAEAFVLDLAGVDPERRVTYAQALAVCGTALSRPTLCDWAGDARQEVRVASLEALMRVGLDERAAALAIGALESDNENVRAMAAAALLGWTGTGEAAAHLIRRLDDSWPVAVQAARSLRSMGQTGRAGLEAVAAREDTVGLLARQMLWEAEVHL